MRINVRDNQKLELRGRIRKANGVFAELTPTRRSNQLRRSTKLRIYGSNVTSVLLYGCEIWKMTKSVSAKLKIFIHRWRRRILINVEGLWRRTHVSTVTDETPATTLAANILSGTHRETEGCVGRGCRSEDRSRRNCRRRDLWSRWSRNYLLWRDFFVSLHPLRIKGNKSNQVIIIGLPFSWGLYDEFYAFLGPIENIRILWQSWIPKEIPTARHNKNKWINSWIKNKYFI